MKRAFLVLMCLVFCWQAIAMPLRHPETDMHQWLNEEASATGRGGLNATLATVTKDKKPSSRTVNFFWDDANELSFYTHSNTQKVGHLSKNPNVSMNIWLHKSRRQITVDGHVVPLDKPTLAKKWQKMPRWMQLRFISSDHKSKLPDFNRTLLDEALEQNDARYPDKIPMPKTFVGYKVIPNKITFFEVKMPDFADKQIAIKDGDKWVIAAYQP